MFHIKLAGDRNNKKLKVSMLFSIVALSLSANHSCGVMQDSNLRTPFGLTIIPNVNLRCICFLMNIQGNRTPTLARIRQPSSQQG